MAEKSATATRALIRRALLIKGVSIAGWARKQGVSPERVYSIITRYGSGESSKVTSPATYRILTLLAKDTGINLIEEAR